MMRRSALSRLVVCLLASLTCYCSSGHQGPAPDLGVTGDLSPGANPKVLWLSYTNMDETDLVLVADAEPPSF